MQAICRRLLMPYRNQAVHGPGRTGGSGLRTAVTRRRSQRTLRHQALAFRAARSALTVTCPTFCLPTAQELQRGGQAAREPAHLPRAVAHHGPPALAHRGSRRGGTGGTHRQDAGRDAGHGAGVPVGPVQGGGCWGGCGYAGSGHAGVRNPARGLWGTRETWAVSCVECKDGAYTITGSTG